MREDIACLLHLWPGSLLAQLETNYSYTDDCSLARLPSLHHGEYCATGIQELGHIASPISATGTARGDPALGGAGRGAGTHRGEPGSPTCQLCHPGCSQTQSAPQSVYVCKVLFAAQQTKCTSAPLLCTLQHTFECFYSKIVGLLARVGGERAELSVWAGGSVGA